MAKRLSEKEKDEIIVSFLNGKTIEELAHDHSFTKLTISRNLKKEIGEKKYKEIIAKKKSNKFSKLEEVSILPNEMHEGSKKENFYKDPNEKINDSERNQENGFFKVMPFVEIAPLNTEIDNFLQKDLSSIPINEVDLPKTVYMVVEKQLELEIRLLRDFPAWEFLSEKDLNRKTIEIFIDIKNAKSKCGKDNKVIKVPNTEVFKIAAKILKSKGISRIVSEDKLISL